MKLSRYYSVLILLLSIVSISACSNDDDTHSDLKDYIIGTWRSFKCVAYVQGEMYEVEVSKNGKYSNEYFEFKFEKDGTVVVSSWDVDEYGRSSWITNRATYLIKDDVVELDNGDSVLTLTYDKNENALYYRYYPSSDGYGYLYLRK